MSRTSGTLIASVALTLALLSSALANEITSRTLTLGGVERDYILSSPASRAPRPTIFILHGGGMNAKFTQRNTGIEPLIDREGIVAVYPNAERRQWKDGRTSTALQWRGDTPEDVVFLRALAAALVRDGVADPKRTYVTGPSNGGMMTLRLVCEASDVFAGAAPMIANLPVGLADHCKPARPMPVLVINGTADPLIPYGGGPVGRRG